MAIVGVALGATASMKLGPVGYETWTTPEGEEMSKEIPPWKAWWMLQTGKWQTMPDEPEQGKLLLPVHLPRKITHMCDKCHVASAAVEIRCKTGSVFLCRHHSKLHAQHIIDQEYGTRELDQ